jgi:hypothetical protein
MANPQVSLALSGSAISEDRDTDSLPNLLDQAGLRASHWSASIVALGNKPPAGSDNHKPSLRNHGLSLESPSGKSET